MSETPKNLYVSAARTDFKAIGLPRTTQLLPIQAGKLRQIAEVLDWDFETLLTAFSGGGAMTGLVMPAPNTPMNSAPFNLPKAMNATALTNGATAILVSYTQAQNTGGLSGKMTARFAIVPASWDDFSQVINFTFPGWIGTIGTKTARNSKTAEVVARLHRDYYVVDPDGLATGINDSGGSPVNIVTNAGAIPRIARQYFWNTYLGQPQNQAGLWAPNLVPAAGYGVGGILYQPTIPTVEAYQQWIDNAASYQSISPPGPWDATHPPVWDGQTNQTTPGQFIFKDSWIEPYAGNIVARVTGYVLAI